MSRFRQVSTEEVLREIHMDSDSEADYSDDEPDDLYVPDDHISSDSDPGEGTSSDNFQNTTQFRSTRGSRATRARARGGRGATATDAGDNNRGWYDPGDLQGRFEENPPFLGQPGIQEEIVDKDSPEDYFKLFIGEDIWTLFVVETNRYAQQVIALKPECYNASNWKPTDVPEMKRFMALLIATGIVGKPFLRHFWSLNSVMYTPFFPRVMTRDRFFAILAFFHLNDNDNQAPRDSPDYDKLFKVRPLYDHLVHTFAAAYYPEEHVAVDESIMPWRGKVSFRMFIPNKPVRYGMKLYCLCESSSGYIVKFRYYTGADRGNPETNHGPNVVKELMEPYLGKGHTVFTDSFFTTVPLFEFLKEHDTLACGTVQKNRRDNPPDISAKRLKLGKGEHIVRQRDAVVAIRYNDRKDFMILSTKYGGNVINTGRTNRRDQEPIRKPSAVHHYNQHMNGVDLFDQHMSYYTFSRKTMKWWKRAATHFVHMAKIQAFILHRKLSNKKINQVDFTLKLIEQLVNLPTQNDDTPQNIADPAPLPNATPQHTAATQPREPLPLDLQRLSHAQSPHWLESIPPTAKKLRPTKNCHACTIYSGERKGYIRRKESRYQCSSCKVPLCVEPCFRVFHTHKDFTREMRRYHQVD